MQFDRLKRRAARRRGCVAARGTRQAVRHGDPASTTTALRLKAS